MYGFLPFAAKLKLDTGAYYLMLNLSDSVAAMAQFPDAAIVIAVLEWSGALIGLLGAFLLATHSRVSRYGWVAFLIGNIVMLVFAFSIMRMGLLVQQIGFLGTTILGLKRAGFFRFEVISNDR